MKPVEGTAAGSRTTDRGNAAAHPVYATRVKQSCWIQAPAHEAVAASLASGHHPRDWAASSDRRDSDTFPKAAAPPPLSHTLHRDTSGNSRAYLCRTEPA